MSVKRDVINVRARYESLMELARQSAAKPVSPLRDQLLTDVMQTLHVVRAALAKADDARRWAREVFGESATDKSPITLYLSQALSRSLNATMGQQIYRLQNFLAGRKVSRTPHPAGMLAVSALSELTR